jgi:hypothetical protein
MSATNDDMSIWKSKPKIERILILCVVVAVISLILIAVGSKFFTRSDQTSTTGIQKITYAKRYTVNSDAIYAATSLAVFDTMVNCILPRDKATIARMASSGDIVYLSRGTVVLLIKVQVNCYVVHREDNDEMLYIMSDHLKPE